MAISKRKKGTKRYIVQQGESRKVLILRHCSAGEVIEYSETNMAPAFVRHFGACDMGRAVRFTKLCSHCDSAAVEVARNNESFRSELSYCWMVDCYE